jgi:uncharacterized membrane protein
MDVSWWVFRGAVGLVYSVASACEMISPTLRTSASAAAQRGKRKEEKRERKEC